MESLTALVPLLVVVAIIILLRVVFRRAKKAWQGVTTDKAIKFQCPMCEGDMSTKLDTSDTEGRFEFDESYDVVAPGTCPFCKTEIIIAINRESREIKAFDPKWEKAVAAHKKKTDALEQQQYDVECLIDELEGQVEDGDKTASLQKKLAAARKKMDGIESKMDKAEESFDTKKERYQDRQMNWQMKYDDKYG